MTDDLDNPRDRMLLTFIAFRAAHDRFKSADHNVGRSFAPMTETLWWAVSLDEALRDDLKAPDYATRQSADPDGRVFQGIRFARNRGGHQRAFTTTQGLGWGPAEDGHPLGLPMVSTIWRPVSDLPQGRKDTVGESTYRDHLAGRRVNGTIDQISRWFANVAVPLLTA